MSNEKTLTTPHKRPTSCTTLLRGQVGVGVFGCTMLSSGRDSDSHKDRDVNTNDQMDEWVRQHPAAQLLLGVFMIGVLLAFSYAGIVRRRIWGGFYRDTTGKAAVAFGVFTLVAALLVLFMVIRDFVAAVS